MHDYTLAELRQLACAVISDDWEGSYGTPDPYRGTEEWVMYPEDANYISAVSPTVLLNLLKLVDLQRDEWVKEINKNLALNAELETVIERVKAAVDHLDVARDQGLVYTYGQIQETIREALEGETP